MSKTVKNSINISKNIFQFQPTKSKKLTINIQSPRHFLLSSTKHHKEKQNTLFTFPLKKLFCSI